MVGLIGHPWEGLDVYVYAGQEEVAANFFNIGTTLFGLGNPGFSNATCFVTTPFSFSGGTPTDCIANNKRLSEITAGFWQNVYKGDYSRVTFGAQYEYIKRRVEGARGWGAGGVRARRHARLDMRRVVPPPLQQILGEAGLQPIARAR